MGAKEDAEKKDEEAASSLEGNVGDGHIAEPAAVPPTTESEQVNDETAAVAKRAVDDAIDEAVDTRGRQYM